MTKIHKKEILRQLIHMGGVLLVLVPWGVDFRHLGAALIGLAILGFLYSELINKRDRVRKYIPPTVAKLEEMGYKLVKRYERPRVRVFKGAMMFFFGVGFSMIVFPAHIAVLATIALAVGDSMSTLVGIHIGNHKLPKWVSTHKSWEGSTASFVSVFAVAYFFASPSAALITALVASIVEGFDTPVDDNIAIPIFTGAVLLLIENGLLASL